MADETGGEASQQQRGHRWRLNACAGFLLPVCPTVPSIERQLQTSAFQVGQRNSHKKQKKPTACIPLQDEAQQPQPAGGLPNMQQTGEAVSEVRPKHSNSMSTKSTI